MELPELRTDSKVSTILDNRADNTVLTALRRLVPYSSSLDVATGIFEIGSLLELDLLWQDLQRTRILMGDETTRRTKRELVEAVALATDQNIETEKERDDRLIGLPAVRQALADKKIAARVYTQAKFHAKAYLMEARDQGPVDFAVVGSSNFTRPGLTQNLELNLFTTDQMHIQALREWYEEVWREAEDVSAELLRVIDPHLRAYDPFTVYAKALQEYFAGREKLQDEWEANDSAVYRILSQYQKDGYHRALQIAEESGGVLICDGVGLGKTFIGLMILERCIRDGRRVLLVVPKSAEQSIWRSSIDRYLGPRYKRFFKELFDLKRHTDFGRYGTISDDDLQYYDEHKDVIIIDEAHHFRNPLSNRGELMMRLAANKQTFMLTATPINNSLDDLYHLINYLAQNRPKHFARIGIQNLRKHFLEAEKRIESERPDEEIVEAVEEEDFLRTDVLLKSVLIQRSRRYVKESEAIGPAAPMFPERQLPRVINYSLKSVYATIYGEIKEAFDRHNPFLSLAIYNTSAYHKDPDRRLEQRQIQLIGLIRVLLLKRLESSFKAFEASVEDLLAKMAGFMRRYDPDLYGAWDTTNRRWWSIVQAHIAERLEVQEAGEAEEEDEVPEEERLFNPEDHEMDKLLADVQEDAVILTRFLSGIYRRFYAVGREGQQEDPAKDDKLQQLVKHLQTDRVLKGRKVVIFTEFRDTARYLARQLRDAGIKRLEQIDSGRAIDREVVIKRFAPYYNCDVSDTDLFGESEVDRYLNDPIDVLISTDILSEGLNLQDASLVINYDLHWNPVRLMQRIGRVDRRLNPEFEARLKRPKDLAGKIYFWNFLPPKELEDLLHLKHRLDGKIVRINATLGIEGAILTPDDPEMSLKEFNERYEGKETIEELMNLERQRLSQEHPDLWRELSGLPRRLFSGKAAGDGFEPIISREGEQISDLSADYTPGLLCAYRMPALEDGATGEVRWYFREAESGKIHEDLAHCWAAIRCRPDTSRRVNLDVGGLADARKEIERHVRNTRLKEMNAPIGAKPVLIAWMEVC
jgi:superfamily II DNA or RNA helicase